MAAALRADGNKESGNIKTRLGRVGACFVEGFSSISVERLKENLPDGELLIGSFNLK